MTDTPCPYCKAYEPPPDCAYCCASAEVEDMRQREEARRTMNTDIKRFYVRDGFVLDEHPQGQVVRYGHHMARMERLEAENLILHKVIEDDERIKEELEARILRLRNANITLKQDLKDMNTMYDEVLRAHGDRRSL